MKRAGATHELAHKFENFIMHKPPACPAAAPSPPVVMFGGTAQTLDNLVGHHIALAQSRAVLQYDLRGQGRITSLPLTDCRLEQHVADYAELVALDRSCGVFEGMLCGAGGSITSSTTTTDTTSATSSA